jgi:hypothetical protein
MTYKLKFLIASLDRYLSSVPRGDSRGPFVVDAIRALKSALRTSRTGFDSSGEVGYL